MSANQKKGRRSSASKNHTAKRAGSRTSTARRKSAASKGSTSKQTNHSASVHESRTILKEIGLCLILAISILMILAIFGIGGRAGNMIRDCLFGVYGLMTYILPFVLFFGYAFFVANAGRSLVFRKLFGLVLMFQFMAAFLHLLTVVYSRTTPISYYYMICSNERSGGGVVGAWIVMLFGNLFGQIGAYVLTIFGIIIAAIVMTQKPLISTLGKKGAKAASDVKENRDRVRADRAEIKELKRDIKKQAQVLKHQERVKAFEERKNEQERRIHTEEAAAEIRESSPYAIPFDETGVPDRKPLSPLDAVTLMPRDSKTDTSDGSLKVDTEASAEAFRKKKRAAEKAFSSDEISVKPRSQKSEVKDEYLNTDGISINGKLMKAGEMPEFLRTAGEHKSVFADENAQNTPMPELHPSDESDDMMIGPEPAPEEPAFREAKTSERQKQSGNEPPESGAAEPRRKSKKEDSDVSADMIASEIQDSAPKKDYQFPSVEFLSKGNNTAVDSDQHLMATASLLQQTFQTFGVNVKVINVSRGPTVTRYELQPEMGVKVSKILSLQDDIKLNLATSEIRIEAPIQGKAAVGIEVPNKEVAPVMLREIIDSPEFRKSKAKLAFAVGKDIGGRPVIADIEKMPHLLIAGATGSGKSVCINTLIMSILYKAKPDEVKMLMIDPKVVELKIYDGIPHLLIPVVTDAKKAAGALNWAVQEMTERYNKFAAYPGVRDIKSYNERIEKVNIGQIEEDKVPKMPRIVIIVDELADLMMVASKEVEDAICRLAQLARAAGIHIIIATQRPSVNVVTGLIKANMPSRIALSVTSGIDSRTILDMNGAEKLLGKGDMLFYPQDYPKPARVQGCYVSDENITDVVEFLISQSDEVEYNNDVVEKISSGITSAQTGSREDSDSRDEYFADSGRLIIEKDKASIGMLQRAFKIGFNRAARVMDQLAEAGVVGGEEGTKPRKILMTLEEFEMMLQSE